jgi:hypothetical protein
MGGATTGSWRQRDHGRRDNGAAAAQEEDGATVAWEDNDAVAVQEEDK